MPTILRSYLDLLSNEKAVDCPLPILSSPSWSLPNTGILWLTTAAASVGTEADLRRPHLEWLSAVAVAVAVARPNNDGEDMKLCAAFLIMGDVGSGKCIPPSVWLLLRSLPCVAVAVVCCFCNLLLLFGVLMLLLNLPPLAIIADILSWTFSDSSAIVIVVADVDVLVAVEGGRGWVGDDCNNIGILSIVFASPSPGLPCNIMKGQGRFIVGWCT